MKHFLKSCSILTLTISLTTSNLWAQPDTKAVQSKSKEGNIWYFGRNAGMTFEAGYAQPLENGKLNTEEGCATIANAQGELLFYTDGIVVWDKRHELMQNGSGLLGDPSSTSSGVAIPAPKKPGTYYLFTVAATGGEAGLCYSVIDMSLANGNGAVVEGKKNLKLAPKVTEKLTAVLHHNGQEVWVIAHEWESDIFLAYLVTENGISTEPVKSQVGSVHTGSTLNTQGYMKSNPDGTNIALALEEEFRLELFDFDNSTGKLSNAINIPQPKDSYTYGIEFSPNGSLLYATAAGKGIVYQYNLQSSTPKDIVESAVEVGRSANGEWIGALQLAPDGKIYFPIYNTSFMGVIHEPNGLGKNCGYENNFVELAQRHTSLGLPTFLQSFFEAKVAEIKTTDFDPKNKVEIGKTYVLKNVLFEIAKYDLKTISFAELDKVVKIMKDNPKYTILLSGHTDNSGNKSSNIALSENRAKSVADYIISKGIDKQRIKTEGHGSQLPVSDNATPEGRSKNRRVELLFLN